MRASKEFVLAAVTQNILHMFVAYIAATRVRSMRVICDVDAFASRALVHLDHGEQLVSSAIHFIVASVVVARMDAAFTCVMAPRCHLRCLFDAFALRLRKRFAFRSFAVRVETRRCRYLFGFGVNVPSLSGMKPLARPACIYIISIIIILSITILLFILLLII